MKMAAVVVIKSMVFRTMVVMVVVSSTALGRTLVVVPVELLAMVTI